MFTDLKDAGYAPPENSLSQGWEAKLELGFALSNGKTVLAQRRHLGPLTVQRPFYPEDGVCHVYILHPPGGIVAGDRLNITINGAAGSAALVTTPAAGKFYRSNGALAQQSISLSVAAEASLEWLPQETIIYEGAKVASSLRLNLAPTSRFIGWEIAVLGRPAADEGFCLGEVSMCWDITLADRALYRERLQLDAKAFAARWGLNGHSTCGTLFAYPATSIHLEQVRTLIGESSGRGVTLMQDLLICRALDQRADRLRDFFHQVWALIRHDFVQHNACAPRIWAT